MTKSSGIPLIHRKAQQWNSLFPQLKHLTGNERCRGNKVSFLLLKYHQNIKMDTFKGLQDDLLNSRKQKRGGGQSSGSPKPGGMATTRHAVFIEFTRKKSRLREAKRATWVPPGPILSVDVFATNTILSLTLHPIQSPGYM